MILDSIDHAAKYHVLGAGFTTALEFLSQGSWKELPLGIHPIDGDKVLIQVQAYDTFLQSAVKWEAHHNYCDIQYVVSGSEWMGYGPRANFTIDVPYDEKNDVYFLKGEGQFVTVPSGMFTIFMPQDVHMPRVAIEGKSEAVSKLVFKIRVGA